MITLPARVAMLRLAATVAGLLACAPEGPSDPRTVTVDRGAYDASISPDGSTIAFGLLGRIWLLPMAGGQARQLTSGHGWDHHPVWSPDGEHLAYVHDAPAASEIVLHTFATGTSRTLYGRSPALAIAGSRSWGVVYSFGQLHFHPTDGRLYFVDFRSGIWSVDARGDSPVEPVQLLRGSERLGRPGVAESSTFAFSADGMSMVVEKDTTDLWTQVHVTRLDSLSLTPVTRSEKVKHTTVNWSPDGASLVYLERSGARERIAVHAMATGEIRRIELGPFNGRELVLHPDGSRALVVSGRRLFLADLTTAAVAPVPFEATLSLPRRGRGDLVITNARLFDATGTEVVEGATVEVRDGEIFAVTAGAFTTDSGVRVIDAGGRFLMPGLIDAHTHVAARIQTFSNARLPTIGVTSIFVPGSYLPETLNLRDAVALGVLPGPHLYTSGPAIDGAEGRARPFLVANVTDADEVRSLIRELADQGVDAIKLYAFLEPEIVAAAIAEAHAHGLPVIGDQVATPWSVALEAGIDGFVHVMDHKWRFISHEQPDSSDGPWAVVDPDSALMNAFFARVAANGAMFDPTMMASSQFFQSDAFSAALREGLGDPDRVRRAHILADMLTAMHRHGVRWVAGTDAGGLLNELAIYEAIGIPNSTILQTATANVARWLRKDDFGTVEPGKRADLIVVDGNPLERIRDLEKVVLVVQDGRVVVER
jgi:imidazolonepropionase-like amidohydrolase/Tol biopolymer transport system component